MTIGKNLSGIDVKYDYSSLITKLYPRGAGSAPSELTLNNPPWYPSGDLSQLVFDHSDGSHAHFRLAGDYSAYVGDPDYGDGWPINSTFYIGRGLSTAFNAQPSAPLTSLGIVGNTQTPVAEVVYLPAGRVYDVSFLLKRYMVAPAPTWPAQPRFIVGLYSTTNVTDETGTLIHAPYQGPLTWCYGSLFSISTTPTWYSFPLQSAAYPAGWYAVVLSVYNGVDSWDKINKGNGGWSDYLAVYMAPVASGYYGLQSGGGVTPNAWWAIRAPGATKQPQKSFAFQLRIVTTDVSNQFTMSGKDPGRMVKTPISDYVPGQPYIFHYQHTPHMIAWDAYDQFGKIEGTYKDDSTTTQNALYLAGQQYLMSASQPIMTISLSAADLYDLDPVKNWAEELTVGGLVRVIDDVLGLDAECVVTKIEKQDLTQPHQIDTLTLNNVHVSAQKLMAQLSKASQRSPKYLQGQTVETPYTTAGSASSGSPAQMMFSIRSGTTLTHSVKLSVDAPGSFQISVDGNAVGSVFTGMNEIDVTDQLTKAHNGQPTPGVHTVTVKTT